MSRFQGKPVNAWEAERRAKEENKMFDKYFNTGSTSQSTPKYAGRTLRTMMQKAKKMIKG